MILRREASYVAAPVAGHPGDNRDDEEDNQRGRNAWVDPPQQKDRQDADQLGRRETLLIENKWVWRRMREDARRVRGSSR
jgi:hypothetical protein